MKSQALVGEMINLTAPDGFSLAAFRVKPKESPKGGIVVLQEIFGLTEQMKGVVRSYAEDGFDAIFPCVFDRVAPDTVVPFSEPERGRDLAYGLPLDKVMLDVAAAAACVQGSGGASVIGFCWGGGVIVRAAAEIPLRSAVSYYGTRLPTYLDQTPKCPLLFHFGATDPNTPAETIDAVRKAFPAAETWIYQAGHAFANEVRPAYVPDAATLARQRTLEFLRKNHGR